MALLTTLFTWALKNQLVSGFFGFIGSWIIIKLEDYIKKKFFPKPQEVIIEKIEGKPVKKKVASKKNVSFGYTILLCIFVSFGFYIYFTYQQFPYLNKAQIVEEIEKIKLFIMLFVIFLSVKLLSFHSTLKEMFEVLPLVKNFIKK